MFSVFFLSLALHCSTSRKWLRPNYLLCLPLLSTQMLADLEVRPLLIAGACSRLFDCIICISLTTFGKWNVTLGKGWQVTGAAYLAGEFAVFFSSVACASIS